MIRKPIVIVFIFLLIASGLYLLLLNLFHPRIQFVFSLRSLYNGNLQLVLGDSNSLSLPSYPIDLHATQFFSSKVIEVPYKGDVSSMFIELDKNHPELFIQSVQVVVKQGYHQQELFRAQGSSLVPYIQRKQSIASANDEFVFVNHLAGQQVDFKAHLMFPGLKQAFITSTQVVGMCLTGSVLLALFICSAWMLFGTSYQTEYRIQWQRIPVLVYGVIMVLGIIVLNNIVTIIPDKESHENRNLASLPALTNQNVFDYPELLTQYTNDHFAFRNRLFSFHSLIRARYLKASSLPEEVIVGKDQWFFKQDPLAIQDMRRLSYLPETSLQQMVAMLRERITWLQQQGIRYYIMVPPNPERIYPDHYPDRYAVVPNVGHDRLDFYKRYLKEQLNLALIDPTDSLLFYRHVHDVYYSNDTHWNLFGAWVGYTDLIHYLQKDFPCLHPITYDQLDIKVSLAEKGDLAAMLGIEQYYPRNEIQVNLKDTSNRLEQSTTSDVVLHYHNTHLVDSCHLRAIVFRDSYSNYLLPYLNKHFEYCTYVWTYNFMHDMIAKEKPDLVILEAQQRVLYYALHAPNLFH